MNNAMLNTVSAEMLRYVEYERFLGRLFLMMLYMGAWPRNIYKGG